MTRTAESLHSQQRKTGLGRMIPTTLSEETKTESPSGGHGMICKSLASSVLSISDADVPPRLNGQLRSVALKQMLPPMTMWQRCCKFLKRDPTLHMTEADVRIPGLKKPLHQYQSFATFCLHVWAREGNNGSMLADGMGLGQIGRSTANLASI